MSVASDPQQLKSDVRAHWTAEPCGTREVGGPDRRAYFDQIERERYELEPFIPRFAGFAEARGKKVLEIGVGAGTDFIQWLRNGADATGIDLTDHGIALTRERAALEGFSPELRQGDAESLPFADNTFDIVYSYGVLHHTPDTEKAVAEVLRVLKPGGTARLMLYHYPSMTALLLWGVHFAAKGQVWKSPRQAVHEHLESPGTKAYTLKEFDQLLKGFGDRRYEVVFLGGDLLSYRRSKKYQSPVHRVIWAVYPTGLVKRFGKGLGHGTLIEARKPL
ncbi:MAG: class I SAM-dependent methyltransferase [Deltaproteobacteria bacterium]|nr:class I SAM-dependent methyltransferase [Deltaproteobacteria bacterium]